MGDARTIVIPPRAGEILGDSPDRRVEVLSDADALHATWSRFGPGREGADLHVHHHHTDLFYVLEGELTVRLGAEDRQLILPSGALVQVPPLVVHGFRNASDADVVYLNFHAPGCGFIGFMRGIRDRTGETFDQHEPPPDGGRPIEEATVTEGDADVDGLSVRRMRLGPGETLEPHDWLYVLEGELGDELVAGTWIANSPDGTTTGDDGATVLTLDAA
jgi:mannose-6-phosphate isomerase-like protein (cupin superfamily)